MNLSRSLYCNATGTRIEWNVKGASNSRSILQVFSSSKRSTSEDAVAILVSESSDTVYSHS